MIDLYELKQLIAFADMGTLAKVAYPDMMVESAICQNDDVEIAWRNGECDVAILPYDAGEISENIDNKKSDFAGFMNEKLFVCVPPDHRLAESETLTFADINGFNFLLRSELGFWDTMCRQKMPASKFLVQTDEYTFDELARSSSLPCFTTDYSRQSMDRYCNRVNIPLTDAEADVTFYLAVKEGIDRNKLIDMRYPVK